MGDINYQVPSSPFLRLPFEIRLLIYEHLLQPSTKPSTSHSFSVTNMLPDHHTYYSQEMNNDPNVLSVRTIDPYLLPHTSRTWRRRSTYRIRTGPFLTHTTPTTYRILLSPYTSHLRHTVPSLLPLNRQIHAEASAVLYSTYTFNFHTSIESLAPFLSDLTTPSRSSIRHIALTKKPLPYTSEFDRAEWLTLCKSLAVLRLQTLTLNVCAGKPAQGWDAVVPLTCADFEVLRRVKREGYAGVGGVDLEWAEQLIGLKGLKDIHVRALVEHCPPPRSETMAFWVAFSKSVEDGFAEWVRSFMVLDKK
ncbi:hypothetical protein CC78DRAFT_533727 [Lojkania enalia]|uniref:Uncharacterized protein n=1 Tax=Lojkania enalia TaxID=147567 RepID=A0A9P4MZH5_9PLEO|nr:hypothetical protein CC78DRAFT_533727 [Didymosphaeria enalia]